MVNQVSIFLLVISLLFAAVTCRAPARSPRRAHSSGNGVLAQLYQRAVNEHRPLVLVLDSDDGPLHQLQAVGKPKKLKNVTHKRPKPQSEVSNLHAEDQLVEGGTEVSMLKVLVKKISALVQHKSRGSGKKSPKKSVLRTKEDVVKPLLKSLLRVSNDMNCEAKNECEEKGNTKDECEQKFECEEEEKNTEKNESGCEVGEVDECETEFHSTKGYTLEPEDTKCTRC